MRMVAAGHFTKRFPGLDRHFAVSFWRQIENYFCCIDVCVDTRPPLGRAAAVDAVIEFAQSLHFMLGVPDDALAAVSELIGKRSEGGETTIGIGIVALH